MSRTALILWITAYSLTLINLTAGGLSFLQFRRREVRGYLILLLHLFPVSLISLVHSAGFAGSEVILTGLLANALVLLYGAVLNQQLIMIGYDFPFRRIFFPVVILVLLMNGLRLAGINPYRAVCALGWIPFLPAGVVIGMLSSEKPCPPDGPGNPLTYRRSLNGAWNLTGLLVLGFGMLFIFLPAARTTGGFALFYGLYNLPGLFFFLNRLISGNRTDRPAETGAAPSVLDCLTGREREVALLIIGGRKYREIAEDLFISFSTVKKHANNIYRKTGAANGRQLIRMTMETGPVPPVSSERI